MSGADRPAPLRRPGPDGAVTRRGTMDDLAHYTCPSCGETIDVRVDPSAGTAQEYVEDCPVCCRPNVLRVSFDDDGAARIDAVAE